MVLSLGQAAGVLRASRPGAFGPPVSASVAVRVGRAHAAALGFAPGAGLHVLLGMAVADTDTFAYPVGIALANPGHRHRLPRRRARERRYSRPRLASNPGPWASDPNYRVGDEG